MDSFVLKLAPFADVIEWLLRAFSACLFTPEKCRVRGSWYSIWFVGQATDHPAGTHKPEVCETFAPRAVICASKQAAEVRIGHEKFVHVATLNAGKERHVLALESMGSFFCWNQNGRALTKTERRKLEVELR